MEYVTLIGTEAVQSAANRMMSAADSMKHTFANIEGALTAHQRFMDDWLQRFQDVMERHNP